MAMLQLCSARMREDLSRRNIGRKVRFMGLGRPPPLSPLTHRPSKDQATIAKLQKEIDDLKSRLELVAKHSPVDPIALATSHPSVDTTASVSGEGRLFWDHVLELTIFSPSSLRPTMKTTHHSQQCHRQLRRLTTYNPINETRTDWTRQVGLDLVSSS